MSNVENGIPCYRITQGEYDALVALNQDPSTSSQLLRDLIDAFQLTYNLYPNMPYDGYVYAPAAMIDTVAEEDWIFENTDMTIYYFRTSVQPGGGN